MSIFDCPIARCEVMRTLVITDQTQKQCSRENGCDPATQCPLECCFTGHEWIDEAAPAPAADGEKEHRTGRKVTRHAACA